jgi:Lon protease-like protein
MPDSLLPLFPLKVVLFPRTELPLHIFEERYKEMIGECLAAGSQFGIVLVLEQGLASTGCTASVTEVIRKFADGRMDILVRGGRRFDLVRIDQERSFLRGEAEFFDDDEADAADTAQRLKALELFRHVADQLSNRESEPGGPTEPPPEKDDPELSFQIASRLPADLPFRQTLLQLRSERERLERVISYLKKLTIRVTRAAEAQAKASGNGRAH